MGAGSDRISQHFTAGHQRALCRGPRKGIGCLDRGYFIPTRGAYMGTTTCSGVNTRGHATKETNRKTGNGGGNTTNYIQLHANLPTNERDTNVSTYPNIKYTNTRFYTPLRHYAYHKKANIPQNRPTTNTTLKRETNHNTTNNGIYNTTQRPNKRNINT